jgi:hypothetical protein
MYLLACRHAFEADVLQDIVEGRVPKELDALVRA